VAGVRTRHLTITFAGQRKKLGSKLKMGFALGSKRSDAGYNFKPVFSSGIGVSGKSWGES